MKVTPAKAWAATIGALATFLVLLGGFLSDGTLDGGEMATGAGGLITLVTTVYAVWRTRNQPVKSGVADGSVRRTYTE